MGAAQHGRHPATQHARAERLGDVVVGPQPQAAGDILFVVAHGQQDDRHGGNLPQQLQCLKTVHFRHHHVHNDEVGIELAHLIERLQPVLRLDDLVLLQFHVHADEAAHAQLVIYDEDKLRGAGF